MGCVLKESQKTTALQVFDHTTIRSSPFPYCGTLGDVRVGSAGPGFWNNPKNRGSCAGVIPRRIPPHREVEPISMEVNSIYRSKAKGGAF